MIWFGIFLSALGGVLVTELSWWALLPLTIALLIAKQRNRTVRIVLFLAFVSFIFLTLGQKLYFDTTRIYGLVYKSSENYCLVMSFNGRYYVQTEGVYEVGDIVRLEGYSSNLAFTHYQELFDFANYLKSYGVKKEFIVTLAEKVFFNPLRPLSFKNSLLQTVNFQIRPLVSSFVFGDAGELINHNPNLISDGLLSVFRLSGLHIAFTFALVEKYWSRKHGLKSLFTAELVFLVLLTFLSNYRLALVRLTLSRGLRKIVPRLNDRIEIDSLCGLILLILNPHIVTQASFYLTFPLLFILGFSQTAFKRVISPFRHLFIAFVVYLYFLPYTMTVSYTLSPFSFFFRLIALPLGQLGFIVSLAVCLPFGEIFTPLLVGLNSSIEFLNRLSYGVVVGKPLIWYLILMYLTLFTALLSLELNCKKISALGFCLMLLLAFAPGLPLSLPRYEVHFIDVGQGDATLIRDRNRNYLIDTGGNIRIDMARECLIPYFRRLRIRKLDKVYITHGDYDHSGALKSLQEQFSVTEVFFNRGDELIEDLNTYKNYGNDLNYSSSVYYFTLKDTGFLLMGDAPVEIENFIRRDRPTLDIDVLKLGHHGSKTSSSYEFLSYANPELAVISCGYMNRYGHPHSVVLSYLKALDIKYHRTDLAGTLIYRV